MGMNALLAGNIRVGLAGFGGMQSEYQRMDLELPNADLVWGRKVKTMSGSEIRQGLQMHFGSMCILRRDVDGRKCRL
jgi:hypothetical protein